MVYQSFSDIPVIVEVYLGGGSIAPPINDQSVSSETIKVEIKLGEWLEISPVAEPSSKQGLPAFVRSNLKVVLDSRVPNQQFLQKRNLISCLGIKDDLSGRHMGMSCK